MSHETIQTGVAEVIRKLADYDNENCLEGEWTMLLQRPDRGCVIEQALAPVVEDLTPTTQRFVHGIRVIVYTPVGMGDAVALSKKECEQEIDTLVRHINTWRLLDGVAGVTNAVAAQNGEVGMPEDGQGDATWWQGEIVVSVEEIVELVMNE